MHAATTPPRARANARAALPRQPSEGPPSRLRCASLNGVRKTLVPARSKRRAGDLGACVERSVIDSTRFVSDNQIMAEISATEASKRFADMLDAVEHRGETFTIVRRGRPIATVAPASHTTLAELREFLRA